MCKVDYIHFDRSPVKQIGSIPTTTVNSIICGSCVQVKIRACLKTTLVSISRIVHMHKQSDASTQFSSHAKLLTHRAPFFCRLFLAYTHLFTTFVNYSTTSLTTCNNYLVQLPWNHRSTQAQAPQTLFCFKNRTPGVRNVVKITRH